MTRIVFMGTPEFAVPILEAMLDHDLNVVGAFTQPDRPSGRGHKLTPPPVKQLCASRGVRVIQPNRIKSPEGLEALKSLEPDLCVTAAFGQILSQANLDVPRLGTVNVHASLLPEYRGSCPVNWAIIDGIETTGVTTMFTDVGIDTGDMIFSRETAIGHDETAGELEKRLSQMGAQLIIETIKAIEAGNCPRYKQDESKASYKPMLDKQSGKLDFSADAEYLSRLVRGVNPWPGGWADSPWGTIKIWKATPLFGDFEGRDGEIIVSDAKRGLVVKCGTGALSLDEIQTAGAKRMDSKAYLMGKSIQVGTVLNDG